MHAGLDLGCQLNKDIHSLCIDLHHQRARSSSRTRPIATQSTSVTKVPYLGDVGP